MTLCFSRSLTMVRYRYAQFVVPPFGGIVTHLSANGVHKTGGDKMTFRFDKLTVKGQEAVARAQTLATEAGNPQIEPLHLLQGLITEDDGIVAPVLEKIGSNLGQLKSTVGSELTRLPSASAGGSPPHVSGDLNRVLTNALSTAENMKDEFVSTEHLLSLIHI